MEVAGSAAAAWKLTTDPEDNGRLQCHFKIGDLGCALARTPSGEPKPRPDCAERGRDGGAVTCGSSIASGRHSPGGASHYRRVRLGFAGGRSREQHARQLR